MIWILFLFVLENVQIIFCCNSNKGESEPVAFPPNKYKARPTCGETWKLETYCTNFSKFEKYPEYGPEISQIAAYEALSTLSLWWLYHNDKHYDYEDIVSDNQTNEGFSPTCASTREIVIPVKAMNVRDNKWKYIAQWFWLSDDIMDTLSDGWLEYPKEPYEDNMVQMTQRMVVHKCVNPGKPCNGCKEGSICKQIYGTKTLIALDDDGNSRMDYFKTPQGCHCFQEMDQ